MPRDYRSIPEALTALEEAAEAYVAQPDDKGAREQFMDLNSSLLDYVGPSRRSLTDRGIFVGPRTPRAWELLDAHYNAPAVPTPWRPYPERGSALAARLRAEVRSAVLAVCPVAFSLDICGWTDDECTCGDWWCYRVALERVRDANGITVSVLGYPGLHDLSDEVEPLLVWLARLDDAERWDERWAGDRPYPLVA